jgi:hypothetical protein
VGKTLFAISHQEGTLIHPSLRALVAIVFGVGVAVGARTAEAATHDATQAPTTVAQTEAAAPAPTSTPQIVKFHGSADLGFTRITSPGILTGRIFQDATNQNTPVLQNIYIGATVNQGGPIGGEFDVSLGHDADIIAPFETNTTPAGGPRNKGWDVTQAYIFHNCTKTGGFVELGKFEKLSGIEQIEAARDWNYSRSYLFAANPFTETGARAGWGNDKVRLTLGETLGWDNIKQTSVGGAATNLRTSEASVRIKPSEGTEVRLTANVGKENDDHLIAGLTTASPANGLPLAGIRRSYDAVLKGKLAKGFTLAGNYNYGEQDNVVIADNAGLATGVGQARWQGGAVYANYMFNPKWSATVRAELFRDTGGFVTGLDQKLAEQTATVQYAFSTPLLLRVEYRNDDSNQPYFGRSGLDPVKFQHTLAAEAIVRY